MKKSNKSFFYYFFYLFLFIYLQKKNGSIDYLGSGGYIPRNN